MELTLTYVVAILKTHQLEFNANILLEGFGDESQKSLADEVKEAMRVAKSFVDAMDFLSSV